MPQRQLERPSKKLVLGFPTKAPARTFLRNKLDVPVGWFCVGRKSDVPKDARFVGNYRDKYVWVGSDHFDDLSHFTLIILSVTKHGVSSSPASSGLDYVRR